jgi:hypothetical protein
MLAVMFGLLALNAWLQVGFAAVGRSDDPPLLTTLQVGIGAAGAAASWGSWRLTAWAHVAAAAYSLVTAGMLLSLAPLLGLEPGARGSLRVGSALVLAFGLGSAWYLRRMVHRAREAQHSRPAV